MKVTVGRTVLYKLSFDDAGEINRRRTSRGRIAERVSVKEWPMGAQAHIGAEVHVGEEYPMIVVRLWGPASPAINGQVLLDGNDTLWVQNASEGSSHGQWHWPEIVK